MGHPLLVLKVRFCSIYRSPSTQCCHTQTGEESSDRSSSDNFHICKALKARHETRLQASLRDSMSVIITASCLAAWPVFIPLRLLRLPQVRAGRNSIRSSASVPESSLPPIPPTSSFEGCTPRNPPTPRKSSAEETETPVPPAAAGARGARRPLAVVPKLC